MSDSGEKYLVITEGAAEVFLSTSEASLTSPFLPNDEAIGVSRLVDRETEACVIAVAGDPTQVKFAVITSNLLRELPDKYARDVYARVNRVLKAAYRFPIRLPSSWCGYYNSGRFQFFAVPHEAGHFRWLAEYQEDEDCVHFLALTAPGDAPLLLKSFQGERIPHFRDLVTRAVGQAKNAPRKIAHLEQLVDRVDFDVIGSAAISGERTFDEWMPYLNRKQEEALALPIGSSIKIVGQAGTGKTLALCLRAILECRQADRDERPIRILFTTHSWAMAERIDRTLSALNGGLPPQQITVFPLVQILQDTLGEPLAGSTSVLGDDSSDGRTRQINLISELLDSLSGSDKKLLVSNGLSERVHEVLNGRASDIDKGEFVENLYQEFNGVISAEGIALSDMEKVEDYLNRERPDDLPPFPRRGDRYLALHIYDLFVRQLKDWGYITTDQLVSDAIRILETFSWNVRRELEGYDVVVADELQLFDVQERHALELLTKSPQSCPFVTAEDPSQGVFSAVSSAWRRDISVSLPSRRIEFTTPHRYSAGLLAFVKHLYNSFPLNAAEVPIGEVVNQWEDVCDLYQEFDSRSAAVRVSELAAEIQDAIAASKVDRLAVVALDNFVDDLEKALRFRGITTTVIRGLDDVEKLTYAKRSVVLSYWQYVGGTQFSHVIVCSKLGTSAKSAFARVRELTALYVACSRAAMKLRLVISGKLHGALEAGLAKGVVKIAGKSARRGTPAKA